ncbi:endolytic transglycosylase MltG [Psychromarinibacter halotolerans]|uniref:Endolytic murein transglycosylase n=1 Tax=Psychromarinibacter halotolerans TaxID=1775175 RepID=A0ABV7GTH2_9RHOB|nr:endolytic transglycosylase MltG [Psychromarinibacter halotolerans]MAQ83518.1 branched-chain alpha-keto acid dehydrogenase subunit E2 [Maritimibacter sp.]MDF0594702.1 endolytic transglycosylase MltG [Psychromarinibacter halotolerans]
MWKSVASNGLTLLIVLCVAAAGVIGWGRSQYLAEGPLSEPICLQVESGANMTSVAEDLAGQGAVTNPRIFRIGADYSDKSGDLKAGNFLIPVGASMEEIVEAVTASGRNTCGTEVVYRIGVNHETIQVRELDPATNRFVELVNFDPTEVETGEEVALYEQYRDQGGTRFRVVVAEGVTSWQIVSGLREVDVMTGAVDEIPPEGYLAPDSYEIATGDDRGTLLELMRSRQDERIDAAWQNRAEDLPFETKEEAVILASIVEKETGVPEERGQVASVFVNRLEQGMRLQTDPTVIYGITNGQGVLGRGIRQSELRAETPYNTYVIDGMPPTPIANPGIASLEAAMNPEETPYVFFVADGTGGHAFAETLAEHNENVARWREIEAERSGN